MPSNFTQKDAVTSEEGRQLAGALSDEALASLLRRLQVGVDADEVRQISDQIERVVFHKQL
jgi:hypothetical protein